MDAVLLGLLPPQAHGVSGPAETNAGPAFPASARTNAVMQLTDEQKARTAAVVQNHRGEIQEALKKSGEARRAVFDAIHAEPFDEQAVRRASRKAAAIEEDLNVLRGRLTAELRALLTPQQRTAMDRMKSDLELSIEARSRTAGSLLDAWIEENAQSSGRPAGERRRE